MTANVLDSSYSLSGRAPPEHPWLDMLLCVCGGIAGGRDEVLASRIEFGPCSVVAEARMGVGGITHIRGPSAIWVNAEISTVVSRISAVERVRVGMLTTRPLFETTVGPDLRVLV